MDSLDVLYRRYRSLIYARCLRLLGEREAAEDATQEVFVRMHQRLQTGAEPKEHLRFMYRMTTHYCLNLLRDEKRRAQLLSSALEDPGPREAQWESGMMAAQWWRGLSARLPERLCAPAWLYYVDGLEQDEVAKVLGVSRRTVVSRLGDFRQRAGALMGASP